MLIWMHNMIRVIWLWILFIPLSQGEQVSVCASQRYSYSDYRATSTANEIRTRGFIAEDFYIPVQNGTYFLNIVKATNPRIKGSCNHFLLDGDGAKPRDFSSLNAGDMSQEELERRLRNEPSANSMVYLALNFGHEVYLLNRRPTIQSRTYKKVTSRRMAKRLQRSSRYFKNSIWDWNFPVGGPKFWRFTIDDQAKHDVPEAIDFALKDSGQPKVGLIGHSLGGALILMSLTIYPEMGEKLSTAILWAPSMSLEFSEKKASSRLLPFLIPIIGPIVGNRNRAGCFPPEPLVPLLSRVFSGMCRFRISKHLFCGPLFDSISGKGYSHSKWELLDNTPPFFDSTGFGELGQLAQSIKKKKMHFYDFNCQAKNMEVYGQPMPPPYNLSRIRSPTLNIMDGNTDNLVSSEAIDVTVADLKGPVVRRTIGGQDGILFNHFSFVIHKDKSKLLYIPSLKILESSQ